MKNADKPVILTFIGNYLPGYKAGGILRITVNTVDHLCNDFEFRIITRDRDIGDIGPYPKIEINQWQQVGNGKVFFLSPESESMKDLSKLIADTPHQILYLNSFFEPLTIKVLFIRLFHLKSFKPVIIAPWGEFKWASFRQKFFKKILFIFISKFIGLYNNLTWRASSIYEKQDIIKILRINPCRIQIIRDLPLKNAPKIKCEFNNLTSFSLRIVFLSRISREKNLDYALKVLKKVKARVEFDIYGPAENETYWKECQDLMAELPSNVKANYLGSVKPHDVVDVFSKYDLFFFPTGGEAYGHVIAECLMAGTPVLVSTETPWRSLEKEGMGWDVDLAFMDSFVEKIEFLALQDNSERLKSRELARTKVVDRIFDPVVLEENKQLFMKSVS